MKDYPYIVSCDWFAFSLSTEGGHCIDADSVFTDSARTFHVEDTTEHHPMFSRSCLMKEGSAPIAHIFFDCKRPEQPFSAQLKVDNSRLYFAGWSDAVMALVRALRWRVQGVARIDVCADFNYFANGRLPLLFVRDYLSDPTRTRPSFIRHSSNKFRTIGTRFLSAVNYATISWGTRESAVQTNLYNKSLELREVCDKPWIRQRWVENGLLDGDFNGKHYDVWRVEFSIKPSAVYVYNKNVPDEVSLLSIDNVSSPAQLVNTWMMLHPRYFTFHELPYGNTKRRVRDLPIVTLFNRNDALIYAVKGLRYFRKAAKAEKLLVRRLQALEESTQLTAAEKMAFSAVIGKLTDIYMMKRESAAKENLADDVLQEYLVSCFADLANPDHSAISTVNKEWRRRASQWVRMLKGTHDSDIENFADALRQLEVLSDSDTFQQCLNFANYVAGSTMPDDVISDLVDEDVLDSACLSLYPLTPPQAEDYKPVDLMIADQIC